MYVHHAIVRALFHTDRLPFDLLKYPPTPQGVFLTHEATVTNLTQLKLHDLFLELGQVNMAEKQASELLAADVDCGSIYERLAWIHIIKEQFETARVFVNALHNDPLYRNTARTLVHILDHGLPEGLMVRAVTRRFGPRLTVHFLARYDQIHFKLYAAVDQGPGKHYDDLLALEPTADELEAAARWSMSHDISEGYRRVLKDLLQNMGFNDVADRL